ncbi:homeobox domain-containing protein [Endozoicomonas arenosclerae]|uniref:homeobox domain-containing protein n=1 Tax=Endozoicomonas arenosclerae TaxID=1633495 RepID=UPI000782438C|nr:homeobox domain-containing protein [Endozoicomonas arenosclerae]
MNPEIPAKVQVAVQALLGLTPSSSNQENQDEVPSVPVAFSPTRAVSPTDSERTDSISVSAPQSPLDSSYSPGGRKNPLKTKRTRASRTLFTDRQTYVMTGMLTLKKYLSSQERTKVAEGTSLTNEQVKIWWQNRRHDEAHRGYQIPPVQQRHTGLNFDSLLSKLQNEEISDFELTPASATSSALTAESPSMLYSVPAISTPCSTASELPISSTTISAFPGAWTNAGASNAPASYSPDYMAGFAEGMRQAFATGFGGAYSMGYRDGRSSLLLPYYPSMQMNTNVSVSNEQTSVTSTEDH